MCNIKVMNDNIDNKKLIVYREDDFMYKTRGKLQYLQNKYASDKLKHKSVSIINTGFKTIDSNLKIRNGVYLIGGVPSVGKTSLILQLADNFAKQGKQVLFFSLEQSEYDLTRKSINRIQHELNVTEEEAIKEYCKYAENITTVTSHSLLTVEEIESIVKDYVTKMQVHPMIFVDYLQLIKTNEQMMRRDAITYISNVLVNIVKRYQLPMFVLSALNRTNYLMPIDFESFKESGSLEYDADVVFGIQYALIEDDAFLEMTTENKRKAMNEEKLKDIRKVDLICIKNRFGRIVPKCELQYYTGMDWFVEQNEQMVGKLNKKVVRL